MPAKKANGHAAGAAAPPPQQQQLQQHRRGDEHDAEDEEEDEDEEQGEEQFTVERIITWRDARPTAADVDPAAAAQGEAVRQYLCKWLNYPAEENTWETRSDLIQDGHGDIVRAYERDNPLAAYPTRAPAVAPAPAPAPIPAPAPAPTPIAPLAPASSSSSTTLATPASTHQRSAARNRSKTPNAGARGAVVQPTPTHATTTTTTTTTTTPASHQRSKRHPPDVTHALAFVLAFAAAIHFSDLFTVWWPHRGVSLQPLPFALCAAVMLSRGKGGPVWAKSLAAISFLGSLVAWDRVGDLGPARPTIVDPQTLASFFAMMWAASTLAAARSMSRGAPTGLVRGALWLVSCAWYAYLFAYDPRPTTEPVASRVFGMLAHMLAVGGFLTTHAHVWIRGSVVDVVEFIGAAAVWYHIYAMEWAEVRYQPGLLSNKQWDLSVARWMSAAALVLTALSPQGEI